jgi:histidyl-tRNA synthetase
MDKAFYLSNRLRMKGILVETDLSGKSLKSQMKRADKMGSTYVLIIGDREISERRGLLRNMRTSTQQDISLDALEETLMEIAR